MIRIARVVKVHPGKRRIDCIDVQNGYPIAGAQVMTGAMSSDTGLWAVPSVPRPSSHQAAMGIQDSGRVMLACLLPTAGGRFVVIGFVQPHGAMGAMTEQDDEMVYRHPAGTELRIEPSGITRATLPGGVVLTLGIDGTAKLEAPTKVTFDTPLVEALHDMKIGGKLDVVENITTEADMIASGKAFLPHTHRGDSGGTTGVPN